MIKIVSPSKEDLEIQLNKGETFIIHGVSGIEKMDYYCKTLEQIIESKMLSCRIKTAHRAWIPVAGWVFSWGHNILTFNPDWVIIRNLIKNKIKVKFC